MSNSTYLELEKEDLMPSSILTSNRFEMIDMEDPIHEQVVVYVAPEFFSVDGIQYNQHNINSGYFFSTKNECLHTITGDAYRHKCKHGKPFVLNEQLWIKANIINCKCNIKP